MSADIPVAGPWQPCAPAGTHLAAAAEGQHQQRRVGFPCLQWAPEIRFCSCCCKAPQHLLAHRV